MEKRGKRCYLKIEWFLFCFFFAISNISIAQSNGLNQENALSSLDVVSGTLTNGLTYYIKDTGRKDGNVYASLIVKAGAENQSLNETEFAHFIEHLAFKKTLNFAHGIFDYLEKKNIQNVSLNGSATLNYTSFDFKLSDSNDVDFSIFYQFFSDVLTNIDFDKDAVKQEKERYIQEYFSRNGPDSYSTNKLKSLFFPGYPSQPYPFRPYIENIKIKELQEFYRRWYRPDLCTVIITGDLENPMQIEKDLSNFLSGIKVSQQLISLTHDKKQNSKDSSDFFKLIVPKRKIGGNEKKVKMYLLKNLSPLELNNRKNFKSYYKRRLCIGILNERFKKNASQYLYPLEINSRESEFGNLVTVIKSGLASLEIASETFAQICLILRSQGVSAYELNREKSKLISQVEKWNSGSAEYWIQQLRNFAVNNEYLPSNKKEFIKEIIGSIEKDEVTAEFKNLLNMNFDKIGVLVPDGESFRFKEDQIKSWLLQEKNSSLVLNTNFPGKLMDSIEIRDLKPAKIVEIPSQLPVAKEFLLSNGAKVILWPSSEKDPLVSSINPIKIHGFVNRGSSCFPKKYFASAINGPDLVRHSGIGDLNKFERDAYLDSINFKGYVIPYIDRYTSGIRGKALSNHIEPLFQQIYLYLTQGKIDSIAFKDWNLKKEELYLKGYDVDHADFKEKINEFLQDTTEIPAGHRRLITVAQTEMGSALEIYNELLTNPLEYIFVISGNYQEEKIIPMIRKYLGNLIPRGKNKDCNRDQKVLKTMSLEPQRVFIPDNSRENVLVQISYIQSLKKYDRLREIELKLLNFALNDALLKTIHRKADHSWPYGIISGYAVKVNSRESVVSVHFDADRKDVEAILKDVESTIKELTNNPIDNSSFQVLKETLIGQLENQNKNKPEIKIMEYVHYNWRWLSMEEEREFVKNMTPNDLLKLFQNYLDVKPWEFIST